VRVIVGRVGRIGRAGGGVGVGGGGGWRNGGVVRGWVVSMQGVCGVEWGEGEGVGWGREEKAWG